MAFKFNVVIGNPPYQTPSEGESTLLKPIYHLFIDKAIKLSRLSSLIVPSRWMQGGKGLAEFRERLIGSHIFKVIIDYQYSSKIFPDIWLDGGINYYLIDTEHKGSVDYKFISKNEVYSVNRQLDAGNFGFVLRDIRQLSIIEKVQTLSEESFTSIVMKRNPYGFMTDLFNNPDSYVDVNVSDDEKEGYYKIYGVIGNKQATRVYKYINPDDIKENREACSKYNILFSYAYNLRSTTPPKQILSKPEELCTGTFLNIGPFNTETEQFNCHRYMQTKFFRALLYFHRFQKNTTRDTFSFIPIQKFNEAWDDNKLYKKYNLSEKEIKYIDSIIK